jgi:hypothetical protein
VTWATTTTSKAAATVKRKIQCSRVAMITMTIQAALNLLQPRFPIGTPIIKGMIVCRDGYCFSFFKSALIGYFCQCAHEQEFVVDFHGKNKRYGVHYDDGDEVKASELEKI